MATLKCHLLLLLCIALLESEVNIVMAKATFSKAQPCGNDPDWTPFQNHCYLVSYNSKTWKEAQMFCRSMKAELASIHSLPESQFIMNKMRSNTRPIPYAVWIGLYALETYREFEWTDGSPVDFRNWASGYPYYGRQGEACGLMITGTGLWNHQGCYDNWPFVCKKGMSTKTSTVAASSTKNKSPHNNIHDLGTGAVVGIALGCLVLGIILTTAFIYLRPWITSNILFNPLK
uniref:U67-Liphistoxin-Lth1a_1 n=1 Tax=Liphistius thaleban TaxID=1905330 RepID=A0A4Q8K1L8_9ARAC